MNDVRLFLALYYHHRYLDNVKTTLEISGFI